MSKHRLLFSKEGQAKYISHLDLMRTIQRAFLRAEIKVRHTEGFNPHPYMSIGLPLSVGCESVCELMDFDLESDLPFDEIPKLLNPAFPEGIAVKEVYEAEKKLKEIVWLEIRGVLTYDSGVGDEAAEVLSDFFKSESIVIEKKTKKGVGELDIIPCIKEIKFTKSGDNNMILDAVISAQNPSLNPEYIISAIRMKREAYTPDFVEFKRTQVYDKDMNVFR